MQGELSFGPQLKRIALFVGLCIGLVACDEVATVPQTAPAVVPAQSAAPANRAQMFAQVQARVEPVAERLCRSRGIGRNCDFLIRVDPRRNQPANAYQSEDENGRPVITFTQKMLTRVANEDELAFVMSHEAAHHISNHLTRQRQNAAAGAAVFAGLASLTGGSAADVTNAQRIGAAVGARTYSKDFELEADELGTIITARSGFDPLRGALFFSRIPDPGDQFLGTHPPNGDRIKAVRRTARSLGLS